MTTTTINTKYGRPGMPQWASDEHFQQAVWYKIPGTTTAMCREVDVTKSYRLVTSCVIKYNTFQFQWRSRKRYTPAQALLHGGIGEDIWTEWTAWQGAGVDDTSVSPTTRDDYNNISLDIPFTFSWSDSTTYDFEEWEVRVRIYNQSLNEAGEWRYSQSLKVAYLPDPVYTIYKNTDGKWMLNADWDWGRGNFDLQISTQSTIERTQFGLYEDDGIHSKIYTNLNDTTEVEFPELWIVSQGLEIGDTLKLSGLCKTSDGVVYTSSRQEIILGDYPVSPTLEDPTITFTETELGTLLLEVPDNDYATVGVRIHWWDADGDLHEEVVDDFELWNGVWSTYLPGIPYDVEILTDIYVTNDNAELGVTLVTETIPSKGKFGFTNGETNVQLLLNLNAKPQRTQTVTPDIQTVKVTGRKLPVARFGFGYTRTFQITAIVQDPRKYWGIENRSDVEKLKDGGIWTYYAAGGELRKVVVDSINYNTTDVVGVLQVQITMQEVDATW